MQVDVSIVVSLVVGAVTLGGALSRLGALQERVKALEGFRERAGARLERLEVKAKLRRALTVPGQAVPNPVEHEEDESQEGG